ncbi:MAG: AMP-binding protein [Myxococcales bacterium]|nr:AMP-binding protein [Myxococcales bacterium]
METIAQETPRPPVATVAARRPTPKVTKLTPDDLFLESVYRWERERPTELYMTQPLGDGKVREYTWKDTVSEARRLATYLSSLGYPEGTRLGVLSKNCAHFMIFDLAAWMAGYVTVPLYPTVAAETVSYVLDHSDSKLLFVGKLDEWDKQASGVPEHVKVLACELSPPSALARDGVVRWEEVVSANEPMSGHPVRKPEDWATIVYTSGSTGVPKGVVHDFGGMAAAVKGSKGEFGLDSPNERMISYLPLAHVFERTVVEACSFVVGFRVYFAESLDTFVADIQRARPTVFHSVPRLWLKFQAGVHKKMPPKKLRLFLSIPILKNVVRKKILTGLGLDQARAAITGSAPIPADLISWYHALGLPLCEGYAMSENFSYSHFSRPGDSKPGTVGPPAPDVECKLGDDGEVLVKSPATMVCYYRQPELTDEVFTSDGFLRTGDRGVIEPDGRLRIVGRTKELFKTSKGKYIAPAPIESELQATGLAELACVTGSGLPQPVAIVSLAEPHLAKVSSEAGRQELTPLLEALLAEVNERLVGYEKLDRLYVAPEAWTIENEMLTPTMKIRRAAIDARYGDKIGEHGPTIVWL